MDVSAEELPAEASIITTELLEMIIRRQEDKENIVVKHFSVSHACVKGTSLASVVLSVKVLLRKDEREITENLIFKIPHSKGIVHDWIEQGIDFFAKESGVYMDVIPAMVNLQTKKGLQPIGPSFPKHYYSKVGGANGFIVLKDLRSEGYVLPDKLKGLDEAHCRLVLREMANFHALSFALKKGNPENLKKFCFVLGECMANRPFTDAFENVYKTSLALMKSFTKQKRIFDAAQIMEGWNMLDVLQGLVKPVEPYALICHGDIWCNNTLFKYEEINGTKIPVDVKLLDFQTSRYALPTTDLAYFFFTSTTRTMRKENLKHLLALYHFHFIDCLQHLGLDFPDFQLTVLDTLFKQTAMFGIIAACCLGLSMLSSPENISDFSHSPEEVAEQTAGLAKQLLANRENHYLIEERLVGNIEEAVEMGLL